jgi:hypothetical protein
MKFYVLLFLMVVGFGQSLRAETVNGVNVDALVSFLKLKVHTVEKPFLLYHYFDGGNNPQWNSVLSTKDPVAFNYVQNGAKIFWDRFGADIGDNEFGYGLYFATDPVSTQSFGGTNWVMVQLEVPLGTKLLDAAVHGSEKLPNETLQVLSQLKCSGYFDVRSVLKASVNAPECAAALRRIFDDILAIDGFRYAYTAAYLQTCRDAGGDISPDGFGAKYPHGTAVILTAGKSILPKHIKIFNAKTVEERKLRIRYASLFYRSASDSTDARADKSMVDGYVNLRKNQLLTEAHPGTRVQTRRMGSARLCEVSTRMGVAPNCFDYEDPKNYQIPFPLKIHPQQTPTGYKAGFDISPQWTWLDLEGVPTSTDNDAFIRDHFLGCGENKLSN